MVTSCPAVPTLRDITPVLGHGYLAHVGWTQLRQVAGRPSVPAIGDISLVFRHGNADRFGRRQFGMVARSQPAPTIGNHILVRGYRYLCQLWCAEFGAVT